MSKKREDNQKKPPYMYIIQPDISPPDPNMQSQFRAIIGEDEVKVVEVEEGVVIDEIRIISKESLNDGGETLKQEDYDENQNSDIVVEMSTAVIANAIDGSEEDVPKNIKEEKVRNKKKSFSEMTKEEIVYFLAKMPAAVPKPVCIITIDGQEFRGQVEKQKGESFLLKLDLNGQSELLQVSMEEIEAIEVENL